MKLSLIGSVIGVPLTFLFGAWTPLMGLLLVMIALDIVTGIAKGFYNKELRSRNMAQGMIRKFMIFVVMIMGNVIDLAMFGGLPVASTAVVCFYLSMEGLSVLENLAQMDMPLPSFIKEYLLVLKDKGDTLKQKPQTKMPPTDNTDGE